MKHPQTLAEETDVPVQANAQEHSAQGDVPSISQSIILASMVGQAL